MINFTSIRTATKFCTILAIFHALHFSARRILRKIRYNSGNLIDMAVVFTAQCGSESSLGCCAIYQNHVQVPKSNIKAVGDYQRADKPSDD
jgi:hypothetical protein